MNQENAFQVSRALLLIGGVVAIAFGATALGSMMQNPLVIDRLLTLSGPLMTVVVGVIALVVAGRIKDEPVGIVLAVLGFIAGGVGGVLVAIAAILAIISKHTLKSSVSS